MARAVRKVRSDIENGIPVSVASESPAMPADSSQTLTRLEQPTAQGVGWHEFLSDFFATPFSLWDGNTGDQVVTAEHPCFADPLAMSELVRTVARRHEPEFVAESDEAVVLAIPATNGQVALGVFLTRAQSDHGAGPARSCRLFRNQDELSQWMPTQTLWQPAHLIRLAVAARDQSTAVGRALELECEVESISENLAATYEEISLLYAVSQQLRISRTEDELARQALLRLQDCVPAQSLVIQLLSGDDATDTDYDDASRSRLLTLGTEIIEHDRFSELVAQLELGEQHGPFVANPPLTDSENWTFPEIRELVLVPLAENSKQFGWLAVINHSNGGEFGTVEANLISSVAAMLAIHGTNRVLYREQAEFVANVVRALVSAIDAKDPYTSGHSDRVARFAVRVALELRCDSKFLNTIYLAGLLHDVGKIGIEDSVLRKAGRLSDSEFEHIKLHPELGCKILADLKQLADILPAVLHHHERWDGLGYPHGLAGEETPEIARIMAVADAYDAMTSDRPYRKGLADAKVDQILRDGAGKQWDARVLEAFFAAKPDILAIADNSRLSVESLDEQWT